jgi:hypothetical protein
MGMQNGTAAAVLGTTGSLTLSGVLFRVLVYGVYLSLTSLAGSELRLGADAMFRISRAARTTGSAASTSLVGQTGASRGGDLLYARCACKSSH